MCSDKIKKCNDAEKNHHYEIFVTREYKMDLKIHKIFKN